MSYIDPDLFHGAINDLIGHVSSTDSMAAMSAKGLDATVVKTNLQTLKDDVSSKKTERDKKKTELSVAQGNFAEAAAKNYTQFSNLVDAVAGALGKETELVSV